MREEALVSPVVGGPSVPCSYYIKNTINNNNNNDKKEINEDNKVNLYFLRPKIRLHDDVSSSSSTSSFNNDNNKKYYHRQPISVKCKINAKKDISKYFNYPAKENNKSDNFYKNKFNLITGNETNNEDLVMGSNLSRHHGKGLTGRRTQSSGNLCDSKGKLSHVGKILVPCSSSSEDRYKFSGSLPNNLDNDHDFMLVNNNNVITDTISGNLGGTLPHKKSSVQFNDEVTDFERYRLQTLEGDPWEYHQNDVDIVRCKHGNLNLVRKSHHNSTDEYIPSNSHHYDSELMGTLPKRRIDPKWCDPTSIQSIVQQYNQHESGEIDLNYPQNAQIIHKPTCELMKHHHRQQLERLDDFNSKPTSSEHQDQGYASERSPEDEHPPLLAINPENTFKVTLQKSSRGLGLSLSGGGKSGPVRVKRLFPQQPAALSNKLESGDILLAANGITLSGLTNYEALEVLRTTSNTVELLVCRLPGEPSITPPKAPPTPPTRREASLPSRFLKPVPPLNIEPCGEFDIEMTKVAGSLGFTLRKVDSSALGHYVRALVREPALSDGRIQPGDKIVTVDGVPLSPMSHEEAVALLRQCGPRVKLRLYRDLTQTPVSALSPTEPDHPLRPPRTSLRKEAVDMLCDLAVRKLSPNGSNGSSTQNQTANNCSPRRLRRPASRSSMNDDKNDAIDTSSNINLNQNNPQVNISKPLRPNYLNLSNGESKSEMSNDQNIEIINSSTVNDNELLETGDYYDDNDALIGDIQDNNLPIEPASMPPLVFDTDNDTSDANFSYKNPAYQSANPTFSGNDNIKSKATYSSDKNIPGKITTVQDPAGSKSLLKWKGVMFAPDDSNDNGDNTTKNDNFNGTVTKENKYKDCEVFMVELTRGWNSRLGFSLQSRENSTIISMVHPDSVAAKDGRLKQGDILLMVNDENVENMPTTDIIDLLRKIRGSIGITVARQKKSSDT
ncbi:glutamate receptor-interacting protein 2 [Microplitis demolitor]|uniref:glutamate receptor-interacting protein 2 n=1 Tax=Microplitis demolitor TaxID=69319 RepID=UPI0004CCE12A|nr:glutamate receptor-interacting protein 2 [Microplitis demolitor]XP_014299858.1 glutamate receptor-interacting protein 2 [Microplitis demolitor]XP_014299860.1 glutamate receptor-interacting protein 2 [Microplitis demolitor]XP_014299862.1 glutamate receptor-interacting protein 2 [Microplitis demolitor]XP_053597788.1 glutamate receptor-interacting protein 2 [Microplitis demolitor]XP_053597789.1 glutamate receptor-interacting protein 2 [Microplitis demolitor]XP_053597790.1 glutamate receptor-i